MNEFSEEDRAYIIAFSAGCDYIVHEIERYIEQHRAEPRVTRPIEGLLAHLKGDEKNISKVVDTPV